MIRTRRILIFIGMVGLLLGCTAPTERGDAQISREQFIETNVALRQIDPEAEDAQQQRQEVLRAREVTEEELRRFVEVYSTDTEALAAVWEEIHRRLIAEDTVEAPAGDEAEPSLAPGLR